MPKKKKIKYNSRHYLLPKYKAQEGRQPPNSVRKFQLHRHRHRDAFSPRQQPSCLPRTIWVCLNMFKMHVLCKHAIWHRGIWGHGDVGEGGELRVEIQRAREVSWSFGFTKPASVNTTRDLDIINLAQALSEWFHLDVPGNQGTWSPKDRLLVRTRSKLLGCAWLSARHQNGCFVTGTLVELGCHEHRSTWERLCSGFWWEFMTEWGIRIFHTGIDREVSPTPSATRGLAAGDEERVRLMRGKRTEGGPGPWEHRLQSDKNTGSRLGYAARLDWGQVKLPSLSLSFPIWKLGQYLCLPLWITVRKWDSVQCSVSHLVRIPGCPPSGYLHPEELTLPGTGMAGILTSRS